MHHAVQLLQRRLGPLSTATMTCEEMKACSCKRRGWLLAWGPRAP